MQDSNHLLTRRLKTNRTKGTIASEDIRRGVDLIGIVLAIGGDMLRYQTTDMCRALIAEAGIRCGFRAISAGIRHVSNNGTDFYLGTCR